MGRRSSLSNPAHKKTCAGKNRVALLRQAGCVRNDDLGWGGFMSDPFEAQGKLKVRPPAWSRTSGERKVQEPIHNPNAKSGNGAIEQASRQR
jgi:hypothetical protein